MSRRPGWTQVQAYLAEEDHQYFLRAWGPGYVRAILNQWQAAHGGPALAPIQLRGRPRLETPTHPRRRR